MVPTTHSFNDFNLSGQSPWAAPIGWKSRWVRPQRRCWSPNQMLKRNPRFRSTETKALVKRCGLNNMLLNRTWWHIMAIGSFLDHIGSIGYWHTFSNRIRENGTMGKPGLGSPIQPSLLASRWKKDFICVPNWVFVFFFSMGQIQPKIQQPSCSSLHTMLRVSSNMVPTAVQESDAGRPAQSLGSRVPVDPKTGHIWIRSIELRGPDSLLWCFWSSSSIFSSPIQNTSGKHQETIENCNNDDG